MHFTHPTTRFSMGTANDSLEFPFKMAYQYTCRHLSYSDFLLKLQRFNIFFLLDLFIWSPWWPLLNDILKKVYLIIWRIYKTIREGTLNTNQSNILLSQIWNKDNSYNDCVCTCLNYMYSVYCSLHTETGLCQYWYEVLQYSVAAREHRIMVRWYINAIEMFSSGLKTTLY